MASGPGLGRFALFLALALLVVFPGVLLGTSTFFYRDFGVLAYPTIFHQHASFWRGELPLWNPNSNCGAPFLAQWGTMVLYPLALFYLVLPLPWSLNVFCLAHLFLGGIGMYGLAWRWTEDRFAASVAGLAFVFNGVTLSSLMWPNYTVALGWMPWVILLVERSWRPNSGWRAVALASLGAALQLLSGVPEIVLLTWGLVLGIGLVQLGGCDSTEQSQPGGRVLVRTGTVVLLAGGLTAAQMLPFFDLLVHSQRSAASATAKWTMPMAGWGDLVLPLFRCAQSRQGIFFQLGEEFFGSTYLGIVTLALAIFAACRVRRRPVWLLAGFSLLAIILALGDKGLIYPLFRRIVPALGFIRYPIKFIVLPTFALPVLAAYAIGALRREASPLRSLAWRPLTAIAMALTVCMVILLWLTAHSPTPYDQWPVVWHSAAWHLGFLFAAGFLLIRREPFVPYVVLGLLVADSLVGVPNKTPMLPASILAPGLWELQNKVPPPRFGEGRVFISPAAEERLLVSQVSDLQTDFVGKHLALWSHLNLLEQIPKVNGSSTLQIREEKEIEAVLYATTNTDLPSLNRFLNVTYATTPGQVVEWSRQPQALPLITAGQRPEFALRAEVLRGITNSAFDPLQTVFLSPDERQSVSVNHKTEATVSNAKFFAHRIECDARATEPSLVVLAQSYYHAWQAFVDGRPTPLLHANYAFQAIEIPAGAHHLTWVYHDKRFRLGVLISLGSLLLCVGLIVAPK